jgi:hypothetical protein
MEDDQVPERAIVHRRCDIATDGAPFTTEITPAQERRTRLFSVSSEVAWPLITEDGSLKGPPHIRLRWKLNPGRTATIVGYRRRNGFGRDGDWGEKIVNTDESGFKDEHLDPGDYFYTFCTASDWFFFYTFPNKIQFVQTIPSVDRVLKLMDQAIDFRKKQAKYQKLLEAQREPEPVPEQAVKNWFDEFQESLGQVETQLECGRRINEMYAQKKREIVAGTGSSKEKERLIQVLDGMKRDLFDKLVLMKKEPSVTTVPVLFHLGQGSTRRKRRKH